MLTRTDFKSKISKKKFKKQLPALEEQIYCLQKASWDADTSIIILVEGWETVPKSSLIRSLSSPLDPRGFVFHAIRSPLTHEKARPWLWRFWLKIPERGQWAIFDQSWYRRIFYEHIQQNISEQDLRRSLRDINDFERTLSDDGTIILKFFFHTGKNTFKIKSSLLEKSMESPAGTESKLLARRYDRLFGIYADGLRHTHQEYAPWHIIPADDRRTARYHFLKIIIKSLQQRLEIECKPKPPIAVTETLSPKRKAPKSKRARPAQPPPEMESSTTDGTDSEPTEPITTESSPAQPESEGNQQSPTGIEPLPPDKPADETEGAAPVPSEGEA